MPALSKMVLSTYQTHIGKMSQPAPVVLTSNAIVEFPHPASVNEVGITLTAVALGEHALPMVNDETHPAETGGKVKTR